MGEAENAVLVPRGHHTTTPGHSLCQSQRPPGPTKDSPPGRNTTQAVFINCYFDHQTHRLLLDTHGQVFLLLQVGDCFECSAVQVHDAWLCSACMRLVNGNPGPALAARLGWTAPLPATTLGAQLLELSRLHSQVLQPPNEFACNRKKEPMQATISKTML